MDMGNKDVKMAHASLFSGIGGAELAASWMGWDNKFHCEINPFCRKILEVGEMNNGIQITNSNNSRTIYKIALFGIEAGNG